MDYVLVPNYPNCETAARIFVGQFNRVLKLTTLRFDSITRSLPQRERATNTAICSGGRVNILIWLEMPGTSIEQVERFYAKHRPLSGEMAWNCKNDRIFYRDSTNYFGVSALLLSNFGYLPVRIA